MRRKLSFTLLGVGVLVGATAGAATIKLNMWVPDDNAKVFIQGQETAGTGIFRTFVLDDGRLNAGQNYSFRIAVVAGTVKVEGVTTVAADAAGTTTIDYRSAFLGVYQPTCEMGCYPHRPRFAELLPLPTELMAAREVPPAEQFGAPGKALPSVQQPQPPAKSEPFPSLQRAPAKSEPVPSAQPAPMKSDATPLAQPAPSKADTAPSAQQVPSKADTAPSAQQVPSKADTAPSAQPAPSKADTAPSAQPAPSKADTVPSAQQPPSKGEIQPVVTPVPAKEPPRTLPVPSKQMPSPQGPAPKSL
jgi:hypothetical protein